MRTTTALLAAGLLALPTAPAAAAAPPVRCGATITESVRLTGDLACPGDALVLGASGVTVDLNGHTIRYVGPPGQPAAAVLSDGRLQPLEGVTVRNGRITGFDLSLSLQYTSGASVSRIRADGSLLGGRGGRMTVRHSRLAGIAFGEGGHLVAERNTIDGGIGVSEAGPARIAGNDIRARGGTGVSGAFVRDMRVTGNRISGASEGVRLLTVGRARVSGNRVTRSGVGIVLSGPFNDDVVIRRNVIRDSRSAGVLVDQQFDARALLVEGNEVRSSGFGTGDGGSDSRVRDGIHVVPPDGSSDPREVTLRGNRVRRSAGHAIAAPGVTDGGRNTARGSGASPACVGVVCR